MPMFSSSSRNTACIKFYQLYFLTLDQTLHLVFAFKMTAYRSITRDSLPLNAMCKSHRKLRNINLQYAVWYHTSSQFAVLHKKSAFAHPHQAEK